MYNITSTKQNNLSSENLSLKNSDKKRNCRSLYVASTKYNNPLCLNNLSYHFRNYLQVSVLI